MKSILVALAGSILLPVSAVAADELPEHHKKLYGEGLCAKCELKETEKCQGAIRVQEDKRQVVYYAENNRVSRDFQAKACESVKPVTATGTVRERGGKLLITPKEIAVVKS